MHSNVLDSRSIGLGDAFGQRFMKEGTYRYNVVRPGGGQMVDEFPYEIVVGRAAADREMHQETVLVASKERRLTADNERLQIQAGDLVVWAPANGEASRFEVTGEKDFFGSSTLKNECGYSHAFGLPGDYAWRDANGGTTRGVVRVKAPKMDGPAGIERWKRNLANAQLVMINNGKAEPAEVDIEVGQTVYFAVVNGDGITVTDDQLLEAGGHDIGTKYDDAKSQTKPMPTKPKPTKRTGATRGTGKAAKKKAT